MRSCICFVFVLLICITLPAFAGTIKEFPAARDATADKPQSKAWYHDGNWWCILCDGWEGSHFYKLVDNQWERGQFADADLSSGVYTRADILSKGDSLFVLEWEATSPRLYKYSYDKNGKKYNLFDGFPIKLDVPEGIETMTIAQDTKGRLWIPFEYKGKVKVIYSTSSDHRKWNTRGVKIGDDLEDDDIASIIAFDEKIGIFWSNQGKGALYFRTHRDKDPADEWKKCETVIKGDFVADDHINLALSDDGRIFAVTKTSVDDAKDPIDGLTKAQFILSVRLKKDRWKIYDVASVEPVFKTRPIVVLDEGNDNIYIFYHEDKAIVSKQSSMIDINFSNSPITALAKPGISINNVTSTKQNITSKTGLLILAAGNDGNVYSRLLDVGKIKQ